VIAALLQFALGVVAPAFEQDVVGAALAQAFPFPLRPLEPVAKAPTCRI
jgi:hypothetical protein